MQHVVVLICDTETKEPLALDVWLDGGGRCPENEVRNGSGKKENNVEKEKWEDFLEGE